MSLLLAEWQRFFARRFTRIMLLIVLILMAAIAVGTAHGSHPITPAVRARAQAQADRDGAQQKQQLADCVTANSGATPAPGSPYALPPGVTCQDEYSYAPPEARWFLPSSWVFATGARTMILLFGGLLALFGFATGASVVGAEWSSGGMANLLLWRPKRLTVLATKLAAVLVAVLATGILYGAIWLGTLLGIAHFRGSIGHVSPGLAMALGLAGVRAYVLALVLTVAGFALASIGRSTAGALGVAVGYVAVVEVGGLIALRLLHVARPERFALSQYVAAWLLKSRALSGPQVCREVAFQGYNCTEGPTWYMRMGSAAELIGIIVGVLLLWAFVAFRRRDVN